MVWMRVLGVRDWAFYRSFPGLLCFFLSLLLERERGESERAMILGSCFLTAHPKGLSYLPWAYWAVWSDGDGLGFLA